MRTVKLTLLAIVILGLLVLGLLVWTIRRECQRGNCEGGDSYPDLEDAVDARGEHDFEHPFVSDSSLAQPKPHRIAGILLDADGNRTRPRFPYVIVLEDGRWASGLTDQRGATHPIFLTRPAAFTVYCCDEAYEYADTHQSPEASARSESGEARPLNCREVDAGANVPVGHFVVQCLEWSPR